MHFLFKGEQDKHINEREEAPLVSGVKRDGLSLTYIEFAESREKLILDRAC